MPKYRVTICVLGLALLCPAAASAKQLAATFNEGLEPHAQFGRPSRALRDPGSLTVELTGSTVAQLDGHFIVGCYRRGVEAFSHQYEISGVSPASRMVEIARRYGYCQVNRASGVYADPTIAGWVQIKISGRSR